MKSYVKIYGPPILKAIKALEKTAIDMPEVCIMDTFIEKTFDEFTGNTLAVPNERIPELETKRTDGEPPVPFAVGVQDNPDPTGRLRTTKQYFGDTISLKRCYNIVSKSDERVGENDFFFEWFEHPTQDQLEDLIQRIDNALSPLGCKYAIMTK
jgi:hypothetical protein